MKQDDCYIQPGTHTRRQKWHIRHIALLRYTNFSTSLNVRAFMLPPRCRYDICSSELLCCVYWCLVTDVSGESTCPVLRGQACHEYCWIDCLTFEDETDTLSWNVDKWQPMYIYTIYIIKVKLKWSRYRPGVAQRVGRGIALLFHDRGTRRGWVVSSTPRPHFTPGKDPVPIVQEAGWATGPVWTGGKSRPHRDSIPDRPARS